MKGWMATLAVLAVPLIRASFLQQTSGGEWMRNWVNSTKESKGREYDIMTSRDFIKNSLKSSVFSPICSELNVLLQACAGEYGAEFRDQSTGYISELMDMLGKMDKSKLRASNRVYIPRGHDDKCPRESSGYSLRRYISGDASALVDEHKAWVREESNNLLESTLSADKFMEEPRIYASLVYFKDQWHEKFPKEYTADGDFHLGNDKTVSRKFMNREGCFRHRKYEGGNDKFDMVAVPYVGESNHGEFTRYMVYLIPKKADADLSMVWESFYKSANGNIWELLHGCSYEEIDLSVPIIEKLKSDLDLKDILRSTYGNRPAEIVESRMTACIDVDEEGTEAAALAETTCTDGPSHMLRIKADKPYIAFVHDMTVNRILFIVKDTGCTDAEPCSN